MFTSQIFWGDGRHSALDIHNGHTETKLWLNINEPLHHSVPAESSMSSDKLTQLQAEFNQLLIQFFSIYSYNAQRHPLEPPSEIPGLAFTALKQTEPGPEDTDPTKTAYPLQPVDAKKFEEAQHELAEDLVLKTQQIQRLITDLPGIDQDESQQAEVINKLVAEVEDLNIARKAKRKEMRQLVKRLDAVVGGMCRNIDDSWSSNQSKAAHNNR